MIKALQIVLLFLLLGSVSLFTAQLSGGEEDHPHNAILSEAVYTISDMAFSGSDNGSPGDNFRDINIPPDYLTDFETWPPVDWNLTGGSYSFVQHMDDSGNNWAKASFSSQVNGTSIMTAPPLLADSGNAQLRFTWSHLYHSLYPDDALGIQVSNNLINWSQFWYKTGSELNSNDSDIMSAPGSGVAETIDIPSAYTDSTFWIRFVASSGYGRNLYVDNIIVRQTPTTPLLVYAPPIVDFSLRAQNLTAGPLNLTVTNDGIDTLFIAAADLSILGDNADQFGFSSANLPAALLFGESVPIPVFMTPTSTGMKNATLRIVNNQTRTDFDIPVRGEGADSVVFMNDGFTNAVSGEVYGFYDSGGPDTDYSANEDYLHTFYPPPGMLIQADFLVFSLEHNYDFLYVYSGESTEGLLLGTFTGSDSIASLTSAAGPLTFRFTSDDSVQKPGWIIRISCVPSPELPPEVVVLLSPPEQASGLPVDGFDLIWSPGPGGGVPSTYDVFLSDNLDDIGQYVWTTSESSLNPATTENPVTYNYNLVYYWTVQAFNQYGYSEPAAIQSFRIELSPPQIEVLPAALTAILTHPDSLLSDQTITISNTGGLPLNYKFAMSETTTRASDSGFVPEIVSFLPDGQAAQNAERSPLPNAYIAAGRALFDLQFSYPTYLNDGEYGIATDGNYFYTTDWSSNAGGLDVAKYNLDGSFVEEFTIAGAGSVRDLAYDGQYFYGAAVSNSVFIMDFTAGTLIGTFTAPVSVRAIAYDSEADAFWVGNNWNPDVRLIDRTGAQISSLTTAVGNIAGLAFDNVSGYDPTLWGFTQNNASASTWVQFDLSTGAVLRSYDMANSGISLGGSSAGGCEIVSGLVQGKVTLLGNIQSTGFFGLELCPDFSWVTPNPASGLVQSGESVVININFDATDLDIGVYSGFLKIYNNSVTGQLDVPVTLTVDGIFPAVFNVQPDVSFDFGNIENMNPAMETFTVSNGGGSVPAPLVINAGDIYLTDNTEGSFEIEASGLPVSLGHNESYQFIVTFTPSSPGLKTAVLNIEDNLGRVIHTVNLSGTGILESIGTIVNLTANVIARENVLLSWSLITRNADDIDDNFFSLSAKVSKTMVQRDLPPGGSLQRVLRGYNVYRNGTGPINTELLTTNSYLDEGLITGTYSYAVQGVYYSGVTAMSDSVTVLINTEPPTLPFTETWSGGSFSNNGWTAGSTNWFVRTDFGHPAPCAAFSYTPHVLNYDIPLTSISFDSADLPAIKLRFDLSLSNYSTATAESLSWDIWNGTQWTTLGTVSNAAGNIPWTTYETDISDYAVGNDFQIRFRAHGADNDNINYWNIDNIILKLMVYSLDAPSVSINLMNGMVTLDWEAVENADFYRVYGSDDLYVPDPWTLLVTTADLSYSFSGTEVRKFFRVIAVAND